MKTLLTTLFATLSLLFSSLLAAQTPNPTTTREVTHLLDYLGKSNCQFYRNGSWYNSAKAQDHLDSKYHYFLNADKLSSAESFIELAATESSLTSVHYKVKCTDGIEQESAAWLSAELTRFRKNPK